MGSSGLKGRANCVRSPPARSFATAPTHDRFPAMNGRSRCRHRTAQFDAKLGFTRDGLDLQFQTKSLFAEPLKSSLIKRKSIRM